MATIIFGPYRPMSIEQMKDFARHVSSMTAKDCAQAVMLLDRLSYGEPQ